VKKFVDKMEKKSTVQARKITEEIPRHQAYKKS
jgi:hypothetical protein